MIHNHQILPVSTKNHQWWPEIPNNQPTCTTNMVLSHFMHRLWVLRKRKVLNSILHCICKIFISPGNSSEERIWGNQRRADALSRLQGRAILRRGHFRRDWDENIHQSKVDNDSKQIVVISSKRPTNKLHTSEKNVKKLWIIVPICCHVFECLFPINVS